MSLASGMSIRDTYDAIYQSEREHVYPEIDAIEQRLGYAIGRDRLEHAARTLACPLKVNPPNWQHGRVLYAVTRARLASAMAEPPVILLDIGTAKGFSALCLQWALNDSGMPGQVVSVDAIDPLERVRRNSIAELDGLKNVLEFVEPWPEAADIVFGQARELDGLVPKTERVAVAFVDGKHTQDAVTKDAARVAVNQQWGDVLVFDDMQIPGVAAAVIGLRGYEIDRVGVLETRGYAIARRR